LKEAEIALNKALGMKTMSPDLTTRATQALDGVRKLRASKITERSAPIQLRFE
jgi:hypothetical protein